MRLSRRNAFLLCLFFSFSVEEVAEGGRKFGVELELGALDRIEEDGNVAPERYREVGSHVRKVLGPERPVELVPNAKQAPLPKAVYTDPKGRVWEVVGEYINDWEIDGFELVTPPLDSGVEEDLLALERITSSIEEEGRFGAGISSSSHVTFDAHDLIAPDGDATRAIKTILFIESNWPTIYAASSPKRYGTVVNEYAVPLAVNQKRLLRELADLLRKPEKFRTKAKIKEVFDRHFAREKKVRSKDTDLANWKFRAANYKKFFGLDGATEVPVFEFRIPDLVDSRNVRSQVKLFRAIMERGADLQGNEPFADPFPGSGDELDFQRLSFTVQELDREQYARTLRSLGLDPDEYPHLGRINGSLSYALDQEEVQALYDEVDADSSLRGENPKVIMELNRNGKRSQPIRGPLGDSARLGAAYELRFEIRAPDPLESLAKKLSALWEKHNQAAEAIAVARGSWKPGSSGKVIIERNAGRIVVKVVSIGEGSGLIDGTIQRMLLGLKKPDTFGPPPMGKPESLVDRLEPFHQQYYGRTLTLTERKALEAIEKQASDLPLKGSLDNPNLTEIERVRRVNADFRFNRSVLHSMHTVRDGKAFARAYQQSVQNWLFESEFVDRILSTTVQRGYPGPGAGGQSCQAWYSRF